MREEGASVATLRAALRSYTADLHQELDDQVGSFETAAQYRDFLVRSYRFRAVAEPAVAGLSFWNAQSLLEPLHRDLLDLGVMPPTSQDGVQLTSVPAKLGALYVLEGSALGARLLFRRAQALGFSATFGARHLAQQTAEHGRWKTFLELLDTADIDRPIALTAASDLFKKALAIYSEEIHERA